MNLDAMIDVFFFNSPATTEIYTYLHTLSRHDALPICQPGTRLRQRRRKGARIDREQQIALVDDRAVAEMHAGDRPRDARPHLDRLRRFAAPNIIGPPVARPFARPRDGDGWRRRRGARRAAAWGERHAPPGHERHATPTEG